MPFFTFFQSRNTNYAPSKTQKLTKKALVFASSRKSPTCSKTQESRREWLLYLFQYFGKRLKNAKHQVWIHDNHPIELYSESVVIQKLRYIHNNPVEANWVKRPEDWIYSSASNYAEGKGIFEVQLLWTGFEDDGGWFFGNVDYPTLD